MANAKSKPETLTAQVSELEDWCRELQLNNEDMENEIANLQSENENLRSVLKNIRENADYIQSYGTEIVDAIDNIL